jgi:Coenzyme PQQ synthesis protein D (PqqD)
MNLSEKITIPAHVMAREVGDETVILDLATGTYFGLDEVGGRIWQLLAQGQTLGGIVTTLVGEYEADASVIEQDLLQLMAELEKRQLVQRAP